MHSTNRPTIIYFSGLDGSGKTTLVNMLADYLKREGWPVKVVWLRMSHYLSKPLLLFCRIVRLTEYEIIGDVKVGYHHFYRSNIISWLYVLLRGIDTWFDALFRVYIPAKIFGKTVICDRYVFDALIDLMVDTHINLENSIVWNQCCKLLPNAAPVFYITRDDNLLKECRPETINDQFFIYRKALYMRVFKRRAKNIENNSTIESAFNEIIKGLNEANV